MRRTTQRKVVHGERADLARKACFQLFIAERGFDQDNRVDLAIDEPHVKLDGVVRPLDVPLVLGSAGSDRPCQTHGHIRDRRNAPASSARHECQTQAYEKSQGQGKPVDGGKNLAHGVLLRYDTTPLIAEVSIKKRLAPLAAPLAGTERDPRHLGQRKHLDDAAFVLLTET
jgi:hypothetical protein